MTVLQGSIPALITPFAGDKVDEAAFQRMVDWQIKEGSSGLVPCGTTGESPTLSHDEHRRVVELCIEAAEGRVPVIAGAGSNSTAEAIELLKHAQGAGADAALIVSPYYNKPSQEGLYAHFKALNDVSEIPIILYNIPGRSIVDISIDTMARLAELANIVGVKDATGDLARVSPQRRYCGTDFVQLSGEDGTALAFNAHGGRGCISVSANIAPKACAAFQAASLAGDYATALAWQDKLAPLHAALFSDTSPGPVKFAAERLGLCSGDVRAPVTRPSDASQKAVLEAMEIAGLIGG
ncbi:MAG: 4-hydroxy-tetrahydrodipicolinate synthase [Pseudomonadota bacterium]